MGNFFWGLLTFYEKMPALEYFQTHLLMNMLVFAVTYTTTYLVVYVWLKDYLHLRKMNRKFPSRYLVVKEMSRCVSSVVILTVEEVVMFELWKRGYVLNNLSFSPNIWETHKFWIVTLLLLSVFLGRSTLLLDSQVVTQFPFAIQKRP
mmetsp:Transcript_5112/g.6046  ORF Transcript_5112/g.6046 Transcript_5112/m.6046 type:complete len:148 (+) Transcript_5112:136-579(+)